MQWRTRIIMIIIIIIKAASSDDRALASLRMSGLGAGEELLSGAYKCPQTWAVFRQCKGRLTSHPQSPTLPAAGAAALKCGRGRYGASFHH